MGNVCTQTPGSAGEIVVEVTPLDLVEGPLTYGSEGPNRRASNKFEKTTRAWGKLDAAGHGKDKQVFENNLEWLSWILVQVWPFAHKAIVESIKQNIEPALKAAVPHALSGICFTEVSLGNQAPTFGTVRLAGNDGTECRTGLQQVSTTESGRGTSIFGTAKVNDMGHGMVEIEFDVEWDCAANINIKIPPGINIGIQRLRLKGPVSLILSPILDSMPIVAGLRLFMLSPPNIDWDFTGIADVADHPMIASMIRKVVLQKISDVMVLPNQYYWHWIPGREREIDVASHRFVRPIALVRIGVVEARGLTAKDWHLIGKGTSDPYAMSFLGSQSSHTKVIDKTLNPKWGDASFHDFLVFHRRELLYVTVFDKDLLSADDLIGKTDAVPLAVLLNENGEWRPLLQWRDGKTENHGEVRVCVDLFDIASTPECFSSPPKQIGAADAAFLLTVQLRCLSGLSKADSAGVIVRVIAGNRHLESKESAFVDPASLDVDYIDPCALQCVRFLSAEGYNLKRIAQGSGLTEEQVKKFLGNKDEVPFYASWEENLHLLLTTLDQVVEIEVLVPGDTPEDTSTFTMPCPFYPQSLRNRDSHSSECKLDLELKRPIDTPTSSGSISNAISRVFSKKKNKSNVGNAKIDSRKLVLDVRMDLFGFREAH